MSKMIQISTFPAAPSTERVPSLAERVASLRYSINLRFLNNRVPALIKTLLGYFMRKKSLIEANSKSFLSLFHVSFGLFFVTKYKKIKSHSIFINNSIFKTFRDPFLNEREKRDSLRDGKSHAWSIPTMVPTVVGPTSDEN